MAVIGFTLEAEEVRARVAAHTDTSCGWFIVVTDYDGFAHLHGPYWTDAPLMEKYESLLIVAHFSPVQLNVIPVEGIRPA